MPFHQLNISWNSEHLQYPVICFHYATVWSIINIIKQKNLLQNKSSECVEQVIIELVKLYGKWKGFG